MGKDMGEVIPVPLRASSGSNPSNCGTGSADIDEGPPGVGQDLRRERQRRTKSLLDVSSALKILPDYLTAIETGRFEDLPARVYAVGYVRSYAAYLGLDAASLAARFKTELTTAGVPEPVFNSAPASEGELPPGEEFDASHDAKQPIIRLPSLPDNVLSQAAGVLILVGAVSFSAYHIIASAPQLALPSASVPAQLAAQTGLAGESIAQPPAPEVARNLHLREAPSLHEITFGLPMIDLRLMPVEEPTPKSVEPAPPKPTEFASSPPEQPPLPVLKAPQSMERRVIQSEEVGVAQLVSTLNDVRSTRATLRLGQHYGLRNRDSRITLRLHGATEIRVGDNRNNVLIDRALDAGDTYRVPNLSGLKLSAPDAGAIEIILDDTTVGFAGKEGVPAREISLDPKAVSRLQQGG